MPLPKPKKNESKDDFMDRCMSDKVMKEDYEDEKQRYAVCQTQWDDSRSAIDIERRILSIDDIELRVTDGDELKITGYAAKFGKWSLDLGGFKEKIRKGAFDEALEKSDVRALKNHDPNLLLGRTSSGTLELKTNSVGLRMEIDPPDTNTGRDIIEEIRRKDITGCSFSFTTLEDDWKYPEDGSVERTIIKIGELFDVGPVTYPAYPDTSVAARSMDAHQKNVEQEKRDAEQESQKSDEEKREEERIQCENQREINRKYRLAGRIINRNKPAEV